MEIFVTAIFAVSGVIFGMIIKQCRPEYNQFITISVCIGLAMMVLVKMEVVVEQMKTILSYIPVEQEYFHTFMKMVGIAYISELAADICKDNGSGALANQLQTFGRLSILVLSLPVFLTLIQTIGQMV